MNNPIVAAMRTKIGEVMHDSPSHLMRWFQTILTEVDEGRIVAKMQIRQEMINPIGTLHGGVFAAFADDLIGATVFTIPTTHHFVSSHINTEFFLPAKLGDEITGITETTHRGRTLINITCTIYGAKNRLLARATSTLVSSGIEKKATSEN